MIRYPWNRLGPSPVLLAVFFAVLQPATGAAAFAVDEDLEAVVSAFVGEQMETHGIPGVVVAVVRNGETELLRGYGLASLQKGEEVDPRHTVFRVGSVSKAVTATTALRLVDQGRLSLEAPLEATLRDLQPDRPPRPVTLFHLLTHTAGLNERLFGQHTGSSEDWRPLASYLSRHLPPAFERPGRVIAYNDHGTALAGHVISRAAGIPFPRAAERLVLAPLGMSSTTFEQVDLPRHVEENLARAYPYGSEEPYVRDFVMTTPAAGLRTTALDMSRYLLAHLGHGPADDFGPDFWDRHHARRFGHHPLLPGRAFGFAETTINGHRVVYKDGQASGFSARLLLVPERDVGLFAAINLSILGAGGFTPVSGWQRELTTVVMDHLLPGEEGEPSGGEQSGGGPITRPGSRPGRFAGIFRNTVMARHTLEKVLVLMDEIPVSLNEDGTLAIGFGSWVEIEPGLFQWHEGGEHYRVFDVDDEGRPEYLFVGSGSYERAPLLETRSVTVNLLAAFVLIFLTVLLAGFVHLVRAARAQPHLRRAVGLATVLAGLNLAFLAGFVALFATTDVQLLFRGIPPLMIAVLSLPLIALIPTALLPLAAGLAVRHDEVPTRWMALLWLLVPVAIGFVVWLDTWNLLGYRFG